MPSSLLFVDQFGDAFDQPRFVNLERNFGDDDRVAFLRAAADAIDAGTGAQLQNAAAFKIGFPDLFAAIDKSAGREVGTRYDLQQFSDVDLRIAKQGDRRINNLRQIVRRDLGRHADRNSVDAVDQQIREACRQNCRLGQ